MTSKLEHAIGHAAAGFFVFPLRDHDATATDKNGDIINTGKMPRLKNWEAEATTDPDKIKKWWTKWPRANIAIAAGKSDLIVIDIDPGHGGAIELLPLAAAEKMTAIQETGGGGRHYLYRQPQGARFGNANNMPKGIDSRGDGGYIVAPGSIHPETGVLYAWAADHSPAELTPLPLPYALGALLKPVDAGPERRQRPPAALVTRPAGRGDNPAYVEAAFSAELAALATAPNGDRNNQLNAAAFALGQFVGAAALSRADVENTLQTTAEAIGLGAIEAKKTIHSGLTAGIAKPRDIPAPMGPGANGNGPAMETTAPPEPEPEPEPERKRKPTDDELADQWRAAAPLTAYGLADWRRYDNGLWPVVNASTIKAEIKSVLVQAKLEGIKPTAARLASVTEFCRLDVYQDEKLWDAEPDYLVCNNGALYIPAMELRPHKPGLYATTGVNYDYNPMATAPNWTRFLAMLSEPVRQFLQEFAGYALTTDTRHEIAVWLYGPPGGGKSTFIAGLEAMLGDRAGLLGLAGIGENRFALATLPGKTLMVAAEQPHTFIKSTHILNSIISGENIPIERKFRDEYIITSWAKLCWAMNELPRVSAPTSGLFRRVQIVELPAIPKADRDTTLKDKIAGEGPGILNWALGGLERLLCRGRFDIPAEVVAATDRFKNTNDIPANFVAECCVTGMDYKTQASELYTAYRNWCIENGHKPQRSTSLAADWRRLGFERTRITGKSFWCGIRVAG